MEEQSANVTEEQKAFLVSYMERHTLFAQGEFTKAMGKLAHMDQWRRLVEELNKIPNGCQKTVTQWMTVSNHSTILKSMTFKLYGVVCI